MKDNSKPVFPKQGEQDPFSNVFYRPQFGMTLREYYAGQAMQSLAASPFLQNEEGVARKIVVAKNAVAYSDALIAELEEGENRE